MRIVLCWFMSHLETASHTHIYLSPLSSLPFRARQGSNTIPRMPCLVYWLHVQSMLMIRRPLALQQNTKNAMFGIVAACAVDVDDQMTPSTAADH